MDGFKIDKVPIKDLVLWDENARFPDKYFSESQIELIHFFLSKKDFKIKDLASTIVADFDLPQLEKIIVFNTGEELQVLEGNRRITAYKLLIDPVLAGDKKLTAFFEELKKKISITENTLLECLITDSKEQGLRYIDRKHANGNNEVGWGDTERAHYNIRRGNAKKDEKFKIALAKVIRELDLPESLQEMVLGPGFVTTFYRIINSSPAWKMFGFRLDDNDELVSSDPDFKEKLKVIILNVIDKHDNSGKNKIDSRTMNKNDDIEKYIKSIDDEDFQKVEASVEAKTTPDLFGTQRANVSPKSVNKKANPKSISRSYLIPKTCILQIRETKINNVYLELKDDLLLDDSTKAVPNAVGVLFRVFLEISLDYFLEKEGISVSPNDTINIKIPKVTAILKASGSATDQQLRSISKVGSSTNSATNSDLLSIENFHQYVHSYKEQPTSSDLKLKWDNLQEFFEILWSYLENKAQKKDKK